MSKILIWGGCCAALLHGNLMAQTPATEDTPTFRAESALVRVDVMVRDKLGSVAGLGREDFRVFEAGKPRQITGFSSEDQPVDLVLVIDVSGSMTGTVRKLSAASQTILGELRPEVDRAAIVAFNRRVVYQSPGWRTPTQAATELGELLRVIKPGGGTRLMAAADEAARIFFAGRAPEGRRRAALMVSDNIGQRSFRKGVTNRYWEADAVFCGLTVTSIGSSVTRAAKYSHPINFGIRTALDESMNGLVRSTGGERLSTRQPEEAIRDMIRRLRQSYVLFFPPGQGLSAKPGQKIGLKVELAPEKKSSDQVQVFARRGYLAAPVR